MLPGSVREIFQETFSNCESLKTVVLNEGLEVLGKYKYPEEDDTWNGVFQSSALETIKLPATLKRIEYRVFTDCKNLKRV